MDFDLLDVKNLVDTFDPGEPTRDQWLDARYENHVRIFGHGTPYWRLFYRLCAAFKPGVVVELGAWQATCAAHMAGGNPDGEVWTIDHHGDPGDDENERLARQAAHRYQNLHYLKGWTWDVVGQIPDGIDLLFIDSWHDYEHLTKDWDAYRLKLASPALVVVDDLCETDHATISGMMRAWEKISAGRERFVKGRISTFPVGFFKYVR